MYYAVLWSMIIALITGLLPGFAPPSAAGASQPGQSQQLAAPDFSMQQGGWLNMTIPASCPPEGCAGGQTMGFRFDFQISNQDTSMPEPNAKVCIYAPPGWVAPGSATFPPTSLTGVEWKPSNCDIDTQKPSTGTTPYEEIIAQEATYSSGTFVDKVTFGFRLSPAAVGVGSIQARVFRRELDGWKVAADTFIPTINVIAPSSPVYVTSQPANCNGQQPCFVDSENDLPGGFGTALKDAVDAVMPGSTVRIIGQYSVKTQTVAINQPITVEGEPGAKITYTGPDQCTNMGALISLNHGVTLRNLVIDDGSCSASGDRTLVEINRASSVTEDTPVLIEKNDLLNGANAVTVNNTAGPVTVRYNHIDGISGFALAWNSDSTAGLEMVANHLFSKKTQAVVRCAVESAATPANRFVNHNFWGINVSSAVVQLCNYQPSQRLFSPISRTAGEPGVNATMVMVEEAKKAVLNGQLSVRSTGFDQNYPLYIVDHGNPIAQKLPFASELLDTPHPCSNLYDIFLPAGVQPGGTLHLYFKYNGNNFCQSTIASSSYCSSTASNRGQILPLYWWDNPTSEWKTTGYYNSSTSGQLTECSTTDNELRVEIDTSGKPGLLTDLSFTPFMVGLPLLKESSLTAGNNQVTVKWVTNYEPELSGFYIQRRAEGSGLPFADVGSQVYPIYTRSYSVTDYNLTNDVVYHYQLRIIRTDGSVFYYYLGTAKPQLPAGQTATVTRTPTSRPAGTRTPTSPFYYRSPTRTATATRIGTIQPTRNFTTTPEVTGSVTVTPLVLSTVTPMATLTPTQLTSTATITTTPTPTRRVTRTPAVTLPAAQDGTPSFPSWVSLLLGLLAGSVLVGGAGFYWFRLRQ